MKKHIRPTAQKFKLVYSFSSSARRLFGYVSLAVLLIAFIVLLGGVVYNLVKKTGFAVEIEGRYFFIYPRTGEQLWPESMLSIIFFGLFAIGCYLMLKSVKTAYRIREAMMIFLIGISVMILAYLGLLHIFYLKM